MHECPPVSMWCECRCLLVCAHTHVSMCASCMRMSANLHGCACTCMGARVCVTMCMSVRVWYMCLCVHVCGGVRTCAHCWCGQSLARVPFPRCGALLPVVGGPEQLCDCARRVCTGVWAGAELGRAVWTRELLSEGIPRSPGGFRNPGDCVCKRKPIYADVGLFVPVP